MAKKPKNDLALLDNKISMAIRASSQAPGVWKMAWAHVYIQAKAFKLALVSVDESRLPPAMIQDLRVFWLTLRGTDKPSKWVSLELTNQLAVK
ncbi:MAG: hypothetical protein GC129_03220 [Proteobacteria bacterium]|nr:hypothetical protein [Pseudomonadota bacterium]